MRARYYAVALAILVCACQPQPPKPLGYRHTASDAECAAADATLARLGCSQAVVAGHRFAELCLLAAHDAPQRDWRPDCIALVSACSDVETAAVTPREVACGR